MARIPPPPPSNARFREARAFVVRSVPRRGARLSWRIRQISPTRMSMREFLGVLGCSLLLGACLRSDARPVVVTRAAADLRCDKQDVEVSEISECTYQALGCGKEATRAARSRLIPRSAERRRARGAGTPQRRRHPHTLGARSVSQSQSGASIPIRAASPRAVRSGYAGQSAEAPHRRSHRGGATATSLTRRRGTERRVSQRALS